MEQSDDRHGALDAQPAPITRRSFFGVLLGIGTAGMGALLAVPVLRFVSLPALREDASGGMVARRGVRRVLESQTAVAEDA